MFLVNLVSGGASRQLCLLVADKKGNWVQPLILSDESLQSIK
ncbi:hypothetical protein [Bacillus sp. AY18-3]|nr:hypothetical protein [Bacillus sp. AY18-3]